MVPNFQRNQEQMQDQFHDSDTLEWIVINVVQPYMYNLAIIISTSYKNLADAFKTSAEVEG